MGLGWDRESTSRAASSSSCLAFSGPLGFSLPRDSPRLQVGRAGTGSSLAGESSLPTGGLERTIRGSNSGSDFLAFLTPSHLLKCLLTAHLQGMDSVFVLNLSPNSEHTFPFCTLQLLGILNDLANITSSVFFWTSEVS